MDKFKIEWSAPEFEYREKGISWYWLSVIIAILMLAFAISQKNFLFAFFIVVAEILTLVWGNKEPAILTFKTDEKGISAGENFYNWSEFQTFSVNEDIEGWNELSFRFKNSLKPNLKIKVPQSKLVELQKNISALLPQIEEEPSFIDSLEKLIKF